MLVAVYTSGVADHPTLAELRERKHDAVESMRPERYERSTGRKAHY